MVRGPSSFQSLYFNYGKTAVPEMYSLAIFRNAYLENSVPNSVGPEGFENVSQQNHENCGVISNSGPPK